MDALELVASGAIVIFLTQQAKRWIPSDFLPIVAFVVGIAIQLVNDLALGGAATGASIWTSIVVGAGVGMGAAGMYDLAGRTGQVPPAVIQVDDEWLESSSATPMPAWDNDGPTGKTV